MVMMPSLRAMNEAIITQVGAHQMSLWGSLIGWFYSSPRTGNIRQNTSMSHSHKDAEATDILAGALRNRQDNV